MALATAYAHALLRSVKEAVDIAERDHAVSDTDQVLRASTQSMILQTTGKLPNAAPVNVAGAVECLRLMWDEYVASAHCELRTRTSAMRLRCLLTVLSAATLYNISWNCSVVDWLAVVDGSGLLVNIAALVRRPMSSEPAPTASIFVSVFPDAFLGEAMADDDAQAAMRTCAQMRARDAGCLNAFLRLLKRTRNPAEARCAVTSLSLCCIGSFVNSSHAYEYGAVELLGYFVAPPAGGAEEAIHGLIGAFLDLDACFATAVAHRVIQNAAFFAHLLHTYDRNEASRALLLRIIHCCGVHALQTQSMSAHAEQILRRSERSAVAEQLLLGLLRACPLFFASRLVAMPEDAFSAFTGWSCARAHLAADEIMDEAFRSVRNDAEKSVFTGVLVECAKRLRLLTALQSHAETTRRTAFRERCDTELLRLGVDTVPVPDDMCCPITLQEMFDPHTGSDGFNYERDAIVRHVTLHGSSPFTRQPMSLADLFPNRGLRAIIDNHRSAMLLAARTAYAAGRVRTSDDAVA